MFLKRINIFFASLIIRNIKNLYINNIFLLQLSNFFAKDNFILVLGNLMGIMDENVENLNYLNF